MGAVPRKSDGRRVFNTEFKRTAVRRILTGEKRVAELSRELDIAPGVIRNWKRFAETGATTVGRCLPVDTGKPEETLQRRAGLSQHGGF